MFLLYISVLNGCIDFTRKKYIKRGKSAVVYSDRQASVKCVYRLKNDKRSNAWFNSPIYQNLNYLKTYTNMYLSSRCAV